MSRRQRVLILCTGNSCRSQMAEGYVNAELARSWEARSAGTEPSERVHPLAVKAMAEVGIDISKGVPQPVGLFVDEAWDLVVTVCDSARESCPVFPGRVDKIHISFPDPAEAEGTEEERMRVFRTVRDAIRGRLLPEIKRRSSTAPRGS
jgi:arsenate reductase